MMRGPLGGMVRGDLATLPLYAAEGVSCAIDLSDNTNLWGAPPSALEVIRSSDASSFARYPALYSEPLRAHLLDYVGLGANDALDTVTGCGSDDVLDSAMRIFNGEGARIAYSAPTFSMIPVFAQLNGLHAVAIPFMANLDIDAERLVDAAADITYLCSPNNPTASAATRDAIEYVVQNARGMVILDEAYAEFAPETFVDLVTRHEHLLVTRTFSKAFGLAGLRIGFGVASRELAHLVARARGPYKVSTVAERAAMAVLRPGPDGLDWVRDHATLAVTNRDRLIAALSSRGITTLPSAANFVLAPMPDAVAVSRDLVARGILVRIISGLPMDPAALATGNGLGLRIGVGPLEMMQSLLAAFDEVRPCV